MALLKWYTQPESDLKSDMHFASYYLYDPVSHLYVRIRLDLNRPTKDDDDGNPAIACRKNRIVKVSKDDRKTYSEVKNNNDPKAGGLILDHNRDNNNKKTWHSGDIITDTPYLPDGIKENLEELALKCFNELQISKKTSYNIPIHLKDKNAQCLCDAINVLLKQKSVSI